ncbi:MAG TPA: winged helix-turn-helix domain-containing protein [Actinokineospora sp.]|nr:winged helix-turn-helix domain-containing protein [Actinokineospora sp.]
MRVIQFDAATLANVRLSPSPAMEALAWLERTVSEDVHPVFGETGASARFALRDPDVALVAATMPIGAGYTADFLSPQPRLTRPDLIFATQLDEVAATAPEVVAEQVGQTVGAKSPLVMAAVEAGTFAARAARGLDKFWMWAIRDGWPDLRDRHNADLDVRARAMATAGIGGLLGTLHPDLMWTGSTLTVHRPGDTTFHVERDFVLAPGVLSWPNMLFQLAVDSSTIYYPAHGVGGERQPEQDVARLVGSTRARLLGDLDVPRSTSDLSERLRLSPSTISYHLSVMHGSGLVTRARAGRAVLYRRTDRGTALAGR